MLAASSWLHSQLSHWWRSLGAFRQTHLLARLSWAMLFVSGLAFAGMTLTGEHYYAAGMNPKQSPQDQIYNMRQAARFNSLSPENRGASARILAIVGLTQEDLGWAHAARAELMVAVQRDFSAADLLLKLVAIDLKLKEFQEAKFVYEQFKRVDPKSPIIKLVDEQIRQQAAAPSLPIPDGN